MGRLGRFEISGFFGTVADVLAVVPFCFNEDNSDIVLESFIDGDVTVIVTFGTGKGWSELATTLKEATESSFDWGNYTLGLC